MGDGHDGKKIASSKGMENLSLSISTSRFPRDLLQRFLGTNSSGHVAVKKEEEEDDDDDEIELNLGLSLGGRFGVDKSYRNLVRSSSIANCSPVVRDDNDVAAQPTQAVFSGLIRTSSMPVENEEKWWERKELQSLRRMEAKKRRSEKQRKESGESGNSESGGGSLTLDDKKVIEINLRRRLDKEKCFRFDSSMESKFRLSGASNEVINRDGADVARGKGKRACVGSSGRPGSQGSRGVSSSIVSELDSKTLQGSTGELSLNSIQSLQEGSNKEIGSSGTTRPKESTSRTDTGTARNQGRETGTTSLGDMPSVFTKGDGLNGRRVDGILYKYGRGEEVRIMCVCHGSFHSPADFVKHAGGGDVDNPLKYIVINPSSSSVL